MVVFLGIYSINSCINKRLWLICSNYFPIISLVCLIPSSFSIIFGASCRYPLIVLPAENLKRPTSSFTCYLHYIAILIFQYIARWLKIRVAKGTQNWSDVALYWYVLEGAWLNEERSWILAYAQVHKQIPKKLQQSTRQYNKQSPPSSSKKQSWVLHPSTFKETNM